MNDKDFEIDKDLIKLKSSNDFEWLLILEKRGLLELNFPAKLYSQIALTKFSLECEKDDLERWKNALKERHEEYDNLENRIKEGQKKVKELSLQLKDLEGSVGAGKQHE